MNDLEIIEDKHIQTTSIAVDMQKAEIDQQVATARAFPRSLKTVQNRVTSMATLDRESAAECLYALPRGGKPIKGPSIRFAEILKQSYGNCRSAARVVTVDKFEMYVEAEGVFHDLETNAASTARVRRRISDKYGKCYSDDMIIVTGNAACSIAMRNAILAGVPKPIWREAWTHVEETIAGNASTLAERIDEGKKVFGQRGVTIDEICAALGVPSEKDITTDHILIMSGMHSALENGEATVDEMFRSSKTQPRTAEMAERYTNKQVEKPAEEKKQDTSDAPPQATSEGKAGEVAQASPADELTDEDRDMLLKYAGSLLETVKAEEDMSEAQKAVKKIHGHWKGDKFKDSNSEVQASASAILATVNDLIKGKIKFEDAEENIGGIVA